MATSLAPIAENAPFGTFPLAPKGLETGTATISSSQLVQSSPPLQWACPVSKIYHFTEHFFVKRHVHCGTTLR